MTAVAAGQQGQHLFVWLAGSGSVIALIMSWLVGRSLSARIRHLTVGAGRLSSGQLEYRLDTQIKDELGQLATAFNRMAGGLQRKIKRFEGLIRTSARVAESIEETDETLGRIAEEAANLLGVEGAGFRLLEGHDDLVAAGRYGLAQEVMTKHSLKVGESLTGLVAQEGRTITVADLREDERFDAEHKQAAISHGIVAFLGVPLRYRDRLMGVLNVYGKERHVFDDEEVSLLRVFADHAAIAIEKARLYGQAKRHAEALGKEITERTQAEEVLRRYEHIVSASSDLMAFIDTAYRYQAVNAAYLEAFGKHREDMIGREVAEILGTEIFETRMKPRLDQCLSGKRVKYQHWLDLPGRGHRYFDAHYDPFRDADGAVTGVVVNVRDISEARELSEQLSYQASHDALTGLLNRRAFEQRLQQLLATAQVENIDGDGGDCQSDARHPLYQGAYSFAYLKNLPVDFLKIDGMFVKDIVDDPIDLAMVKSINDMGHVMGKQTIAEFVENDAILEQLREIGVDYAQGYAIAKPQPITVLETTASRDLLVETVPVVPARRA
jgi:PAS domain S-box-containing protein